jgi:hypothetical protein
MGSVRVKNSASLSSALACSNVCNTFVMYRELNIETCSRYNFFKGQKNLLELTNDSISINSEKTSMVEILRAQPPNSESLSHRTVRHLAIETSCFIMLHFNSLQTSVFAANHLQNLVLYCRYLLAVQIWLIAFHYPFQK